MFLLTRFLISGLYHFFPAAFVHPVKPAAAQPNAYRLGACDPGRGSQHQEPQGRSVAGGVPTSGWLPMGSHRHPDTE